MKAVESNPEEYLYSDIYDGLQRLEEANTAIYVVESLLRSVNKEDPVATSTLKTFGKGKYDYWGMLFTMNSPLIPMFRKATPKTFEYGILKRSMAKWLGGEIKSQVAADTMVLSMGQTFIAFIFIVLFVFLSLFTFFLEYLFSGSPKMGSGHRGPGIRPQGLYSSVLQDILNSQ